MRRVIGVALVALVLGGCSSFKLGAVCYLPANMEGTCSITPVAVP